MTVVACRQILPVSGVPGERRFCGDCAETDSRLRPCQDAASTATRRLDRTFGILRNPLFYVAQRRDVPARVVDLLMLDEAAEDQEW
jgi:hypothetical protein